MKNSVGKVGLSAVLLIGTSQFSLAQAPACTETSPSVWECEGLGSGIDLRGPAGDGVDITVKENANIFNRGPYTIGVGNEADIQVDGNLSSDGPATISAGNGAVINVGSDGDVENSPLMSLTNQSAPIATPNMPQSGEAIRVGDDAEIRVDGRVTSLNGSAIAAKDRAMIVVGDGGLVQAGAQTVLVEQGEDSRTPLSKRGGGAGNGIVARDAAMITVEDGGTVRAIQSGLNQGSASLGPGKGGPDGGHAIKVKNDADIRIDGTVSAEGGGNGIDAGKKATIVVGATGLVEATDGVDPYMGKFDATSGRPMSFASGNGIDAGDDLTLVVEGKVSSDSEDGVNAGEDAQIFIAEGGEIMAGDDGINVDEGSLVINDGDIIAGDEGIEGDGGLFVANNGTITSVEHGIESGMGNIIVNNGTITSTGEMVMKKPIPEVSKGGSKKDQYDAISLYGLSLVGNFGTINSADDGINIGWGGLVLNDGDINADDEGVEIGDLGFLLNLAGGSIDAGENGVELNTGFVYNAGDITGGDAAILVTNDPMGEIPIPIGLTAEDEEELIPDPYEEFAELIDVLGETGESIFEKLSGIELFGEGIGEGIAMGAVGLRDLGAVIYNEGTLEGEYGLYVERSKRGGRRSESMLDPGHDDEALSIITDAEIMPPPRSRSVIFINDGQLTGTGGIAASFADGDDAFIWLDYSSVDGDVHMGKGYDGLYVLGAELLTETYFTSLEDVQIEEGVAAIFVPDEEKPKPKPVPGAASLSTEEVAMPGSVNGTLYTASGSMIGAGGTLSSAFAEDIAERVLNLQRTGDDSGIATQGAGGSDKNWWVFGGATFQEDRGQGFTQESQNLTLGRNFGAFDLFVGLQNATANMSASTEHVDQQMLYAGATGSFDINENLELVGMAMLGLTDADYVSGGTTMSADGTFGSVSARLNYNIGGFVTGTYLGYARQNTDALAAGALSFSTQTADAVFGGFDMRAPSLSWDNGFELSPVIGFGFLNGSSDGFTMSAGGISTTVTGSAVNQQYFVAGFDLSYGDWRGTMRVRGDTGNYMTLDLGMTLRF